MATALVSVLLLAGGAGLVWVAWAGSQHRLRRNRWAGIRLPSTMRDDEAWDAAHVAAAGPLGVAGGIMALGGLAVAVSGVEGPIGIGALLVTMVAVFWAVSVATRRAVDAAGRA